MTDVPSPKDVIAHLRSTGTGAGTLEMIQAWIDEHPDADAQELLRLAEDLHAIDHRRMMEGTLRKIGVAVVGEGYGGGPVSLADAIRMPNPLPARRVRAGVRRVKRQE